MTEHKGLIERIEALVKRDNQPDWEDVVRRAEAPAQAATPAPRSQRTYLARRLVPAFALAGAIIAVGLIAPWQHGPGSTVMGRALAAIGDKPVLQIEYRHLPSASYAASKEGQSYVNLATGREIPILEKNEVWYDRARNFQREKFVVGAAGVFPTRVVTDILRTPKGTWTADRENYPGGEGPLSTPLWMTGFFDHYQAALENGTARVEGSGTLDGRNVTWIGLGSSECSIVSSMVTPANECEQRVAVDKVSSRLLRVETLAGGSLLDAVEVLSIETLPAGSGDFARPEKRKLQTTSARALSLTLVWGPNTKQTSNPIAPDLRVASTDLPGAVRTLPGALWAGRSIASLRLSGVSRATARSFDQQGKPAVQTGVELHYGAGQAIALWSETPSDGELSGDGVVIHEQTASPDWTFWPDAWAYGTPESDPPAGLIRMGDHRGWLKKGGLYILIVAPNHDLLLEVARALEPIQP
ncbi:MAG: hypothetical protein ACYDHO_05320 [Gaiellaceae bacterium]